MTDTAIARRELPKEISTVLNELSFSEDIVRAALNSTYKDAPLPDVARALVKCARHNLDPVGDHVVIFKPHGADRYAVFVTLKGYEHIASQHPDFGAITFGDFIEEGNEIRVAAFLHRKSYHVASGPFWGRCRKTGQKSKAKGGGTYNVEWPYEVAQSRAARKAYRTALGLNLPDDDFAGEPMAWRDDQRRHLHFIANTLGWDREQRHLEASKVLGEEITSWADLTEQQAAALQVAWEQLVEVPIDVDPETGEILNPPTAPAQSPIEDAGASSEAPQAARSDGSSDQRDILADASAPDAVTPTTTQGSGEGSLTAGRTNAPPEPSAGEEANPEAFGEGAEGEVASPATSVDDRELAMQRATAALDALFGDNRFNGDRRAFVYRYSDEVKRAPTEFTVEDLIAVARRAEARLEEAPL